MTRYALWFICILLSNLVQAQNPSKPLILELSGGYGFLIPHRPVMRHLPTEHVPSLEMYVGTKLNGHGVIWKGEKSWHDLHNSPEVGFSLLYSGTGNKDLMGHGLAFLTNMSFPMNDHERFRLFLRSGIGIGYISKIFDLHSNFKNIAIGSHFNLCVKLGLHAKLNLKQSYLAAGITMTHFSNGALSAPNLGINLPGANLTYGRIIGNYELDTAIPKKVGKDHDDVIATITYGMKENYPAGGKKFGVYNIQSQYRHYLTPKTAIIGGLDVMYNVARVEQLEYETGESINDRLRFLQPGINIGYGRVFNRLTFFIQNGIYLMNYKGNDGLIYNRVGGSMVFKKWVAHFAVKTHLSKADHFEIGVGKRLWKSEMGPSKVRFL